MTARLIAIDMIPVNVTYAGKNGDLRHLVPADTADHQVLAAVREALESGAVENIPAIDAADLTGFHVTKTGGRFVVAPATPLG